MNDLKEPRESTVRKLFALSSNKCAFPDCRIPIVEPQTGTILGEICHICAQRPSGPRFDSGQTAEGRHSLENLIIMCGVHHKLVDAPESLATYTVSRLLEMKAAHERAATAQELLPVLTASALKALVDSATGAGATTHMDFRGAHLRAGGEGGQAIGAGGGGGGIINIVGITAAGYEKTTPALSGTNATAPGAGGGGGGAIRFSGREVIPDDIHNGFRVSSILAANAAEIRDSLLFVLGGGWEYVEVPSIPHRITLVLVCIFELGIIAANSLLAISVVLEDPKRKSLIVDKFDLPIREIVSPMMRAPVRRTLSFDVSESGVWSVRLESGDLELARLDLDVRTRSTS